MADHKGETSNQLFSVLEEWERNLTNVEIPVITDDQDMTELAHAFDAQVMPTLGLLKTMLDNGRTNKKTINALCDYWRHIGDRSANLDTDFARLFDK